GSPSSLPPEPADRAGAAAGKPVVQNPLWAQAEAAEREGRLEDAEKLYFALARAMNEPGGDHDVANLCYTRIHSLREKKRNGAAGGTVATSGPLGSPTRGAGESKTGSTPPADTSALADRPKWHGPGRLVKSALALDGRKTYALETSPGITVLYV